MKRFFLLALISILGIGTISAQKDKTLMVIGGTEVSANEFLHIYNKNNTTDFDQKSMDEYLQLFINFKLKVIEAEHLKMDTAVAFKTELAGYREQLSKPYLIENEEIEKLMKQTYERSSTEVKLDHIFVRLEENASDEEVKIAQDKALSILKRVKGKENFEKVVSETSDDRGAAQNKGHLWYMQLSKLPYPIQNYLITAKLDEFSEPIRSKYGLHIIRLTGKRPAQGQIKVAHIMVATPHSQTSVQAEKSKQKIDSIYKVLKKGADFSEVAKKSDDPGTANKGGELPWFTTGRMVPEFEKAAFALKNKGDFSKPIKTNFGWHIIKLVDLKPKASYKEAEKQLRQEVENNPEKKEIVKEFVSNSLKKEYKFKLQGKPDAFYTLLDSTVFDAKWDENNAKDLNQLLFTIGQRRYDESDFAQFISSKQTRRRAIPMKSYVDDLFKEFIYVSLTDVEKDNVEDKYPKFGYLMQEYHDGILLFNLTDKIVWSKAVMDSTGLEKFYKKNKDTYKSQLKLDASIFKYSNAKTLKKAEKTIAKKDKKHYSDQSIEKIVDKGKGNFKFVESKMFVRGENPTIDVVFDRISAGKIGKKQKIVIVSDTKNIIFINNRAKDENKKLSEIKGIVIADYQNYLEKLWVEKLQKKYPVKVDKDLLHSLK